MRKKKKEGRRRRRRKQWGVHEGKKEARLFFAVTMMGGININ